MKIYTTQLITSKTKTARSFKTSLIKQRLWKTLKGAGAVKTLVIRRSFLTMATSEEVLENVSASSLATNTQTSLVAITTVELIQAGDNTDLMKILQTLISTCGITTNLLVVIVFLNDKEMRRKIPNICIINQVGLNICLINKVGLNICIINKVGLNICIINQVCSISTYIQDYV